MEPSKRLISVSFNIAFIQLTFCRPCHFFQLGNCKNGTECQFAHVKDPKFKPEACLNFMKGHCYRGNGCTYSHERSDIEHLKVANGVTDASDRALANSEARLKDFRYKVPKNCADARPLGFGLGIFFQQAFELVAGEVGTMQEMVTLLTSDGGLLRIDELLKQPFDRLGQGRLTRVLKTQLMPFFKIFTHANVTASVLLRGKVTTVYNIMYSSDGSGRSAVSLFATLATHLSDPDILFASWEDGEVHAEILEAVETTLDFLLKLIEINTPAQINPGFVSIVDTFAKLLEGLPESVTFTMRKSKKNLGRLQQRLGIGQALPDAKSIQRPVGARATFQLAREMPGELSEQGRRHDNDYVDIENISILPTLQEIQSSRNEYLPVVDPQEWHFGGTLGLVDRHFRLLREDTIGQLRDAAKFGLDRLQNPFSQINNNDPRRQSARTHVYDNVCIVFAAFDEYHGAQVAMRFARPEANNQQSKAARKEWWNLSKRLGSDALICLLSSEGSAIFFVVSPKEQKPTRLQAEYDLVSDPEHAYVVAKPVNQSDLHELSSQALGDNTYAQLSLVEFPGVLLPSFEPTLKAMQRISGSLDMPFPHILAPTSTPENPDREIDIQPPLYATKPGFKFDLSKITTGNAPLYFAPSDSIKDAADQLAQMSTLDLGQAEAVVSSLAHSVALVQGPPGTGKSYTGVQLIRVSLSNKTATEIGPILVCTQTNHALDAILERSVDDSVTNIVRIGSRSKSERLEDVNLRNLTQRLDLTKVEKSERGKLYEAVKKEVKEINKLMEAFAVVGDESSIKGHLSENYPEAYMQIFSDTDEDGFTLVKNEEQGTMVDIWLKASYPGQWRPRPIAELRDTQPHRMTFAERRVIFNSWISGMKDDLHEKLRHAMSSYNESKQRLEVITMELKLRVLRQANIIGITTSGLARNLDLLSGVNPKVLICEEAGEVLEAHMLTAHAPTQYPGLQDDPSVFRYPEVVGMRRRLFWMHHEKLEDDSSDGYSTSRTNAYEVDVIVALVKHLAQQGVYKPADIAVITPYLGQLRKLRTGFSCTHTILLNDRDVDELEKEGVDPDEELIAVTASGSNVTAKGSLNQALRLATVDNFQGEEAKIIIVSLVRSNQKNNPGFLKTPNRINVLLSRAQHGMYIVGNTNTTESVPMWHDVLKILRANENVGDALELCCPRHKDTRMLVRDPPDFARLSPEAGCNLLCEKQLKCGHACVAKCHSDMLHGAVHCMKPCMKLKVGCKHLCPKPCGNKCDLRCQFLIENKKVQLDCGHEKTGLLCYEYQDLSSVICKKPVKRIVPGCNHELVGMSAKGHVMSARNANMEKSAKLTTGSASKGAIVSITHASTDVHPPVMKRNATPVARIHTASLPGGAMQLWTSLPSHQDLPDAMRRSVYLDSVL
ncbi:hypothetical protein GQ44DRAFT_732776 [Phaeosphaeriaceae sp. PMI808]|nr:hypothetical protein GQ44DRAFT_732776 [Phaeosphaeriaceae sp. PMI808]